MRALSDCFGDMLRRRIEDREIEYLLSRQARDDSDGLVSVLAKLSLERLEIAVDDRAADFAATASQLVRLAKPANTIQIRSRVVTRLATAALTAVLIMGLAGIAAADAAAPGDTLYGLDRALERVGINHGGLDERLYEARALADDGQSAEALSHLADALDTTSPNAADALEEASERFGVHDNPSQEVLEDVAAMLNWMAVTQESGRDFGQGVAARAREIGAGHTDDAPAAKPDTPANDGNAGNAGNVDRPVDDDGDANANTDDGSTNSGNGSSSSSGKGSSSSSGKGSSGSSGNGGNGAGPDTGSGGGKGGGNGPPGGSPPGQRAP